jgi:hypothetical protein
LDSGKAEAVLALRLIVENDKESFIAYVDVEKVFDNVKWEFNAYIENALDKVRDEITVEVKIQ